MAAPTKYRPSFNALVLSMARERDSPCTDEEIAAEIGKRCPGGVTADTIREWRKKHKKFREACRESKRVADSVVENATFRHATGYYVPEVKMVADPLKLNPRTILFTDPDEVEHRIEVPAGFRIETLVPHWIPGNHQDRRLWSTNRDPEKWKDVQKIEHSGELSWKTLVEQATSGDDGTGEDGAE